MQVQSKLPNQNLPVELWWKIFNFLPESSKLTVRTASKSLNALIITQIYKKSHHSIFLNSIQNNDMHTLEKIYTFYHTRPDIQASLITHDDFIAFRYAATTTNGDDLTMLEKIYELCDVGMRTEMIGNLDFMTFRWSCQDGNLRILRKLYQWNPTFKMISSSDYHGKYSCFRITCIKGDLEILKQLWEWCPGDEERVMMINHGDHDAFNWTAQYGHLNVLRQLWDWYPRTEMVGYKGFRWACQYGDIEVVKQLKLWREDIFEQEDFGGFKAAMKFGHSEVCDLIYGWADKFGKTRMKVIRAKHGK